jgi:hypothetical protein
MNYINKPEFQEVGETEVQQGARQDAGKWLFYMNIMREKSRFSADQSPELPLWAKDNSALIQAYYPTHHCRSLPAGSAGARLICAAGAFVGPAWGISLAP